MINKQTYKTHVVGHFVAWIPNLDMPGSQNLQFCTRNPIFTTKTSIFCVQKGKIRKNEIRCCLLISFLPLSLSLSLSLSFVCLNRFMGLTLFDFPCQHRIFQYPACPGQIQLKVCFSFFDDFQVRCILAENIFFYIFFFVISKVFLDFLRIPKIRLKR